MKPICLSHYSVFSTVSTFLFGGKLYECGFGLLFLVKKIKRKANGHEAKYKIFSFAYVPIKTGVQKYCGKKGGFNTY